MAFGLGKYARVGEVATKPKPGIRSYRRLRVADMETIARLWPKTPSREIARRLGCSEKTVQTALKALREAGVVDPLATIEEMAQAIAQKHKNGGNGAD